MKEYFVDLKKHVLFAVSHASPAVVIGGIIMGLGIGIGNAGGVPPQDTLAYSLFKIGKQGINLLPVIIAGYIAYSKADKVALAPGLVTGMLSVQLGIGFFGGLIGGILVGDICVLLKKINFRKDLIAFRNMIFIPLVSALVVCLFLQYGVSNLILDLTVGLTNWFASLDVRAYPIVGAFIGGFSTFDLGLFGSKAIANTIRQMLEVIDPETGLPELIARRLYISLYAAVTVPPLACALASVFAPKKFTAEEREAGKSAFILSAFGISEGAIPFALADAKAILPSVVVGGIVTAITCLFSGASTVVGWGGLVNLTGAEKGGYYILSILLGAAVATVMIILLKKPVSEREEADEAKTSLKKSGNETTIDIFN
jgi:fructose-specific PTS system IIC-like component